MTTYNMTPISSGTRVRPDHNVFSAAITSVNYGIVVEGDELWTAPANGAEVYAGDKWLRVTKINGIPFGQVGWMAFVHKGIPICNNFKVTDGEPPPPPPPPEPIPFPDEFILTNPDGRKAKYIISNIIT